MVKVTDFGIARITDSSKTRTGLVLGTPSFMSPEQIAGKKVDGRSELYSLGVMLFQMLTGVLPFRGDSMAQLMYRIANEEAPDLRVLRPELSERLARVVALALAKAPEARYQSGEQFAADLRVALDELPATPQTQAAAPDFGRTVIQGAAGTPGAAGYDAAPSAGNGANARFASAAGAGMPPSSGTRPSGDRPSDLEP